MTDVFNSDFDAMVDYMAYRHHPRPRMNVNLSGLQNDQKQFDSALEAINTWASFTGLTFFIFTDVPTAVTSLTFSNDNTYAYTFVDSHPISLEIYVTYINIPRTWAWQLGEDQWKKGSYGYFSILHEIGHALGLDHPSSYNYDGVHSITYENSAEHRTDTWQYSIMSYFIQSKHPDNKASNLTPTSPMMADILAIRKLYGDLPVNTGDTIYGKGETAHGGWTDFGKHPDLTYCINDTGGHDLLDFSNVTLGRDLGDGLTGNVIDMRGGYFSDINGWTGNVSIMPDTVIEDLNGSAITDRITGNRVANVIHGNGGDDVIRGLEGDDTLYGDAGNDVLEGGDGKDVLDGGTGADRMEGGDGSDTYHVDDIGDEVIEYAGSKGADTVISTISTTLGQEVEKLVLKGAALDGTGNGLNNAITGTDKANHLSGLGGNDSLFGAQGNDLLEGGDGNDRLEGGLDQDRLEGGAGNDWLDGGQGNDILIGGRGADTFVFGVDAYRLGPNRTVLGSTIEQNADIVRDFNAMEGDRIALSLTTFKALADTGLKAGGALTAALFANRAYAGDANDYLLYDARTGQLWYDDNGSLANAEGWSGRRLVATFESEDGRHPASLGAGDFILVA